MKSRIFLFILILSIVESFKCLFPFIAATSNIANIGSWGNQNTSAILLSLLTPYILLNLENKDIWEKFLSLLSLLLISLSIFLLKSRAAAIAFFAILILHILFQPNVIKKIFNKLGLFVKIIIISTLGAAVTMGAQKLYHFKKDSADGRFLIWRIALSSVKEKPLLGHGYGSFERKYNMMQSEYFKGETSNKEEVRIASHTQSAYNEYIESYFQGGILGLLFLLTFPIAIILKMLQARRNHINLENDYQNRIFINAGGIGIIALYLVGGVNFSFSTPPLAVVFVLYSSIFLNSMLIPQKSGRSFETNLVRIARPIRLVTGGMIVIFSIMQVLSQRKITKAFDLSTKGYHEISLSYLSSIDFITRRTPEYMQMKAAALFFIKSLESALDFYLKGQNCYSTPELYQQIGNCFLTKKEYDSAVHYYKIAFQIQPNRFTPLYLLMKLYNQRRDKAKTLLYAEKITSKEVKIPAEKIELYKSVARKILEKAKNN